jgi:geranylgeranyl pyrophosphate synthase
MAKNDLTRGLLVLLVSKAGKHKANEDILPNQRKLAEITEQIHTAHIIHSGIINLPTPNENLEKGNKMAILCGDFIQSRSSIRLAEFKNIKVSMLSI